MRADYDAVCKCNSERERLAEHFWEPHCYPECVPIRHRFSDPERKRDSEHEREPNRDRIAFAERQPFRDRLSLD